MAPEERGRIAPSSEEGGCTSPVKGVLFQHRRRQEERWGFRGLASRKGGGGLSGGFCLACEVQGQALCYE